jgi:transposase
VALAVTSAPPGAPQKSKLRRSKTVHHDGRVAEPGGISRAKVRVKDLHSHSVRALLASRALLVKIKQNLENQIRGLLKNLALVIGRAKFNVFAVRAEELIEDRLELIAMVGPPSAASCGIVQDCMIFNSVVVRFLLRIAP